MLFLVIINLILPVRKVELFKEVEIFTRAVSRKTEIRFMVRSEYSLENCLYQDHSVTFRLKNYNMEEILEFLLPNLKSLILQLIPANMISL